MSSLPILISALCSVLLPLSLNAETPEKNPYVITWNEPGKSADDSVPLGNGEIGLNAWITAGGELEFYISRTDAWDEWGRQVKVGGIRIAPGWAKNTSGGNIPFTQTLDTRTGQLVARLGKEGEAIRLRLWVDARRPIIVAEIESDADISPKVQANLWRLPGNLDLEVTSEVSPGALTMQSKYEITPDTRLADSQRKTGQIGWYHHNGEKPAYAEVAKTQGSDETGRPHPLKDRVFGAIVSAENGQAEDDATLLLTPGKKHVIEIAAETLNPTTPEKWLAHTQSTLAQAKNMSLDSRDKESREYWKNLQKKSRILITKADKAPDMPNNGKENLFYHTGKKPLSIGMDSGGGSGFLGKITQASVTQTGGKTLFEGKNITPQHLEGSADWTFPRGGRFDVTFTLAPGHDGHRRILDKVTPGGSDGFLVDITPERQIRFISGAETHVFPGAVPTDTPTQLSLSFTATGQPRLTCNDKVLLDSSSKEEENAFLTTQAYALQRYVTACGGRGNYPITFNGSIFTVPMGDRPENADYRRWGSGYWWQNTRLPYYSMFMAGDFDMALPLLRMYSDMLPVCRHRAKTHLGCDGAYFAECMYYWGDIFPRTYGTTFYKDKENKLQDSPWHKYEWDSGLEVSCMALEYYTFTQNDTFARERAIPLGDALIRFFNTYYKSDDAGGKLNMTPSQALETWWDCKNSASEVAGLHALTRKLLALPEHLSTPEQRTAWLAFQKKLPPLPVDTTADGERKLAPAAIYKAKSNVEVPELYSVFPYRICSFDQKELLQEAKTALKYRQDRGPFGWRQEDLFMAYLGETAQAKDYLLQRIKNHRGAWSEGMPKLKFPGFWGPNYDWLPDQCHGGVIAATVQSMVMQTSGKKIFLFPAFPLEWNVDFKLHAPYQTTVEGAMKNGKLVNLKVTPESRRKDVVLCNNVQELDPATISDNNLADKPWVTTKSIQTGKWRGFPVYESKMDDFTIQIAEPQTPIKNKPWIICIGEIGDGFHWQIQEKLLKAGAYVAAINSYNVYGADYGLNLMDNLYTIARQKFDLPEKCGLFGISRAGLSVYRWAIRNPEKVASIYCEGPVLDFKTWPMAWPPSAENWVKLKEYYGFASDSQAIAYKGNPIDNLAPIAKAKIPIRHVISLTDEHDTKIVPNDKNTLKAQQYLQNRGHDMNVVIIPKDMKIPYAFDDESIEFMISNSTLPKNK